MVVHLEDAEYGGHSGLNRILEQMRWNDFPELWRMPSPRRSIDKRWASKGSASGIVFDEYYLHGDAANCVTAGVFVVLR